MTQVPIRLALFVLTATIASSAHASAGDCERRIAASGAGAHTVALAGGDSWMLFRQFMAEIERRDLNVSLWTSKVQISRGGEIETFELGWAKRFSGGSAEELWQRMLAGKRAEFNSRLLAKARESGWDIVCAGGVAEPERKQTDTRLADKAAPPASADAVVFFKSGVQYASRRDYPNALKEFTVAERISPHFPGLLMNLGVTHLQLKDYTSASSYLKQAIEQDPKDAAAHYNLACLQARLGQEDDAIASLAAARSNGMKMTAIVKRDPDLSKLRGRADFETLFK
jgi:tetratricopeptide (TPR) repeat protein